MALLRSIVYLIVVLMLLPVVIIIPVALTTVPRISFPPVGIGLHWFAAVLDDPILLQSVGRSFWLAVAAAVLGVLIALPAAFAFGRGSFRGPARSGATANRAAHDPADRPRTRIADLAGASRACRKASPACSPGIWC